MDMYCNMNGAGWARPHCPAVGGCITSYTKERRGPNSLRGVDTENGHTPGGTASLATNPHTHCSEEHKAALADPMAAHTSASIAKQWVFSLGQGAVQNCESSTQGLSVCMSACAWEGLLWVSGGKGQSGEFPPLWPFVTSGF